MARPAANFVFYRARGHLAILAIDAPQRAAVGAITNAVAPPTSFQRFPKNKFENDQHAADAATELLTVDVRSVRKIRTGIKAGGLTTGKCIYLSTLGQPVDGVPPFLPGA